MSLQQQVVLDIPFQYRKFLNAMFNLGIAQKQGMS
jgi:hypothetical protein